MIKRRQRLTGIILAIWLVLAFSVYAFLISPAIFAKPAKVTAKTFDLVEVTDVHGYIMNLNKQSDGTIATEYRTAVLAKQIDDIKVRNPNTIVLAGGDMFQGTSWSLYSSPRGRYVTEVMKTIGFKAMALGNHEYDWGIDAVIDTKNATLKNSAIPVLAANVFVKSTGKPAGYVKPYALIEQAGVKIAVIGIVDPYDFKTAIRQDLIIDIDFKDPVPIVNRLAKFLRQKRGAQIVLVLAHMGARNEATAGASSGHLIDFAQAVTGVDAIFGGHTHSIVYTTVQGIPVDVANCNCQGYIDLKLTVAADGKISYPDVLAGRYINISKLYEPPNAGVDPLVKTILDRADREIGPLVKKVIGTAAADITRTKIHPPYTDSALGNWVAEVIRNATKADFGFANNGGLRIDIKPGPILIDDIFQLMPFDNTVVTVEMTGAQLQILLETAVKDGGKGIQIAGFSFTYDPEKPTGHRVFNIKKSEGTPLDPNASYRVATSDFVATGGDGFTVFKNPAVVATYHDTQQLVRDELIKAVQAQGGISSKIDNRIKPGQMPVNETEKP